MSGGIAGRGKPGERGPIGPMGPTGPQGPAAFSLSIGQVQAVPYGEEPSVENSGTAQDQIWDIAVPTGATGVLTGVSPPSGTDGTSLGQLYYCSSNRTYYGLVELRENDNKWSPIMSQETSRFEHTLEAIAWDPAGQHYVQAGTIHLSFDDVRQVLSVAADFAWDSAAGGEGHTYLQRLAVDLEELAEIKAQAGARGITAVPLTMGVKVNGVISAVTVPLLGNLLTAHLPDGTGVAEASKDDFVKSGSGTTPGFTLKWEKGVLQARVNESGAPGGSVYGDMPNPGLLGGHMSAYLGYNTLRSDETYPASFNCHMLSEVPYVN